MMNDDFSLPKLNKKITDAENWNGKKKKKLRTSNNSDFKKQILSLQIPAGKRVKKKARKASRTGITRQVRNRPCPDVIWNRTQNGSAK